jgi:hypothetical protein
VKWREGYGEGEERKVQRVKAIVEWSVIKEGNEYLFSWGVVKHYLPRHRR